MESTNILLFFVAIIVILGFFILNIAITIAYNYLYARSQNMDTVGVKESLVRGFKRIPVMLLTAILAGIIIFLGLIAFIIPGIYLLLRLSYLYPIVANENLGPIQSIKRSFLLTKGNLWDIMGLTALAVILTMIIAPLGTLSEQQGNTAIGITLVLLYLLLTIVIGVTSNTFLFFRYHQSDLEKRGELTKKQTHAGNYIAVILAVVATIAYGGFELQAATNNINNNTVESEESKEHFERELENLNFN